MLLAVTYSLLYRWLYILHRETGTTNFAHNWAEYKDGFPFGSASGELWFGLEYMHQLTSSRPYTLRIDLTGFHGDSRYAKFSTFEVTSEADKYRLLLGSYSGDVSTDEAQDRTDGFLYHNNSQFTTPDDDNDALTSGSCITQWTGICSCERGGFWYKDCAKFNPTSVYCPTNGCGYTLKNLHYDSFGGNGATMSRITMMIRPRKFASHGCCRIYCVLNSFLVHF